MRTTISNLAQYMVDQAHVYDQMFVSLFNNVLLWAEPGMSPEQIVDYYRQIHPSHPDEGGAEDLPLFTLSDVERWKAWVQKNDSAWPHIVCYAARWAAGIEHEIKAQPETANVSAIVERIADEAQFEGMTLHHQCLAVVLLGQVWTYAEGVITWFGEKYPSKKIPRPPEAPSPA